MEKINNGNLPVILFFLFCENTLFLGRGGGVICFWKSEGQRSLRHQVFLGLDNGNEPYFPAIIASAPMLAQKWYNVADVGPMFSRY